MSSGLDRPATDNSSVSLRLLAGLGWRGRIADDEARQLDVERFEALPLEEPAQQADGETAE